jgi:hypothetical protein
LESHGLAGVARVLEVRIHLPPARSP